MANYIRRHQKKNELFAKRERALIAALKRNDSEEKLVRVAEKIREAKLQQLKSEQNKRFTLNGPEAKDEKWQSIPVEDIITIYKNKITKNEVFEAEEENT